MIVQMIIDASTMSSGDVGHQKRDQCDFLMQFVFKCACHVFLKIDEKALEIFKLGVKC